MENLNSLPTLDNNSEIKLERLIFREETVLKKLKGLKVDKSRGPDDVHPRVLKELSDVLAKPTTILFQKCLDESYVPQPWKLANVTPIHKKGSRNLTQNYRPISLTCILCKIFESILKDEMMTFMLVNKKISVHQHGFMPGRSCVTQLLESMESWVNSLDDKYSTDIVYLDFKKAFDSVPHKRLLIKLRSFGIDGFILEWIENYLKDRKQLVVLDGEKSPWLSITSGVPQGSVIGPILFLLYINDLPDVVQSVVKLFADDAKLFRRIRCEEDCDVLQSDLEKLQIWSSDWQLQFHPDKCFLLRIGSYHPSQEFVYKMRSNQNEVILPKKDFAKDLGVVCDKDLKFTEHINEAVGKANRMLGIIRRSFDYLERKNFVLLYKTIVRSVLEYAAPVWFPQFQYQVDLIESVQRRATKLMPGMSNLEYVDRLKILKLPTLLFRRVRGDLITLYKVLNGKYNIELLNLVLDTNNTTRGHTLKLKKFNARLNVQKNSFSFRVINWWNSLPEEVISAPSVDSFKKKFDKHTQNCEFKYDFSATTPVPQNL